MLASATAPPGRRARGLEHDVTNTPTDDTEPTDPDDADDAERTGPLLVTVVSDFI